MTRVRWRREQNGAWSATVAGRPCWVIPIARHVLQWRAEVTLGGTWWTSWFRSGARAKREATRLARRLEGSR